MKPFLAALKMIIDKRTLTISLNLFGRYLNAFTILSGTLLLMCGVHGELKVYEGMLLMAMYMTCYLIAIALIHVGSIFLLTYRAADIERWLRESSLGASPESDER